MTTTYLDDFMEKMATVPNDANRFLRLIRNLDKKLDELQVSLVPQQNKFLSTLKDLKEKKITEVSPAVKAEYDQICKKQKEIYGLSKEKKEIAEQLHTEISKYHEQLGNELKNKQKDKPKEEEQRRRKVKAEANKLNSSNRKEEYFYDPKDCQYCYCGKAGYGGMVECDNPYCEREWFHMTCID